MGDNLIIQKFDTPFDFLQWATHAPCKWTGSLQSRAESSENTRWTGTRNYEEAYNLALYGWEEGLKMLSDNVKIAEKAIPPITKPERRYDIAGYYPNPARAAAGEIFSMVAFDSGDLKRKPIVRLRTHFGAIANVEVTKIMQWGAAICSYINKLEQSGQSVQLDSASEVIPSKNENDSDAPSLSFQFSLKKAGEPLSLATIVFWWGHPSALRRITFSGYEKLNVGSGFID